MYYLDEWMCAQVHRGKPTDGGYYMLVNQALQQLVNHLHREIFDWIIRTSVKANQLLSDFGICAFCWNNDHQTGSCNTTPSDIK